ncbi:uncharacterized protein LOC143365782 isoform X2 [Halictus rubicundus]|uniref:uncharacterized protein LOC143365782 isoform X2 n=1 Tax=Halictus rubicundus TaxID=77578 RepID=UPI0040355EBC
MSKTGILTLMVFLLPLHDARDDRVPLGEDERRWNTPPELIPEEVIKGSNAKSGRSLSIPITANINLNTGNNAHSLGFQVGPEGLSYSESNSFNHPLLSQSQAASLAVGPSGISGSTAQAVGQQYPIYSNQGHANSQSLSVNAAASSSASVQNGQIATSAASSVSSSQSSASSNAGNTGRGQGTKIRFPEQNNRYPVWTNIRPNNNNGRRPPTQPKLEIDVKPNRGHRVQNGGPIVLEITSHPTQQPQRRPMVHVRKWHPSDNARFDDK